MRDLILKMSISLDGFVSGGEGRNGWMFGDDHEAKAWSAAFLSTAGLHAMGARSFLDMAAWWPTATGPFAAPMNRIPKAVFSRRGPAILEQATTPAEPQPGGESWARAYVSSGALGEEIARLKGEAGKPIIADGGVGFAQSLVAQGLVDQFVLLVAPVALGRGLPLFSALATPMRLALVSSKAFRGGAVAQTYRPA